MPTSPIAVANSILRKSFEESVPVTPLRLQRMTYILAAEYEKEAGAALIGETFLTWSFGPVLASIRDNFLPYGSKPVLKYGKDAMGDSWFVDYNSNGFHRQLDRVWAACRYRSDRTLIDSVRQPGGAWDKAYQADKRHLDPYDIGPDHTYRGTLGL